MTIVLIGVSGLPEPAICVTFALICDAFPMAKTKTATLNLRIAPGVKEAVRVAAEQEHRSVANMVEILIRRHSAKAGIPITEQSEPLAERRDG